MCDRDCFNCKYDDCICEEVTDRDLVEVWKAESAAGLRLNETLTDEEKRIKSNENQKRHRHKYKEHYRQYRAEYYEKNKERLRKRQREYQREYRRKNKEKLSEYTKKYRKKRKEEKMKEIKAISPEDEMKKEYELFLLASLGMDIDEFIDKSCTYEEFKKMKERERKNQGIQG